jgi:hypothetical protein
MKMGLLFSDVSPFVLNVSLCSTTLLASTTVWLYFVAISVFDVGGFVIMNTNLALVSGHSLILCRFAIIFIRIA